MSRICAMRYGNPFFNGMVMLGERSVNSWCELPIRSALMWLKATDAMHTVRKFSFSITAVAAYTKLNFGFAERNNAA